MKKRPIVISIAAVSGGGKTTVTNQLLVSLSDSIALYFDDYDFEGAPANLINWVNEGANYDIWDLAPLVHDIQSIMEREQVKYIILDYPFAYLNEQMRDYIDFTIFIDTPLDVALARRIIRDYDEQTVSEVVSDLNFYLKYGREAYLTMEYVKKNSDLIADGTGSSENIVDVILEKLESKVSTV
ncbi:hypothetical protein [Alkalibacillus haloalkaliphilus]|uniref:hypothetical protein n=1 Tax=Alkalibacillus haloalkaliphilus TaxID=94136 RepID=UPI002935D077|nr:hypothetical protein [Alkalibacillus haloalkaliphilus]MDV2581803.1 hypothetical protein [Alkalibacillus haloalkaliphilus]